DNVPRREPHGRPHGTPPRHADPRRLRAAQPAAVRPDHYRHGARPQPVSAFHRPERRRPEFFTPCRRRQAAREGASLGCEVNRYNAGQAWEVARMELPYRFPDPLEEAARRAQEFQRLPPDERLRQLMDVIETGLVLARLSPNREAGERLFQERE